MKQNPSRPEAKTKRAGSAQRERAARDAEEAQVEQPTETAATVNSPAAEDEGLDERMLAALHAASDRKALDLIALDLRAVASFTDFFLIASGTNQRQVQAIADAVVEQLKTLGSRALRVEGYNAAEWVLLDYGDFIFHIFEDKARRFYDLERLWREAARVPLPGELAGTSEGGDGRGNADGDDSSLRSER
ncbi:MAG TPA: ribosome silencing factor [Pyrinomonadaceae bacterium]|nr:ribosome silencing factor [Pyrinomonadaceae bacterium]